MARRELALRSVTSLKAGAGDQSPVRRQLQPHTTPATSQKTILLPRNFNEFHQ
jgi:hypothetical protein